MDNLCKICNLETIKIVFKNNQIYYSCKNCNFISLDHNFVINKENEKKRYLLHKNSIEDKKYVEMLKDFIAKSINPITTNIKDILDFGCGHNPVLAQILTEMKYNTNYYDPYFFPNLEKTKKYDLVVSTEVFEHLINPLESFQIILNLLNENGSISIMTKFIPKDNFENWWYLSDETHISFYNKKTFEYLANKFNLKILFCDDKELIVLQKK